MVQELLCDWLPHSMRHRNPAILKADDEVSQVGEEPDSTEVDLGICSGQEPIQTRFQNRQPRRNERSPAVNQHQQPDEEFFVLSEEHEFVSVRQWHVSAHPYRMADLLPKLEFESRAPATTASILS